MKVFNIKESLPHAAGQSEMSFFYFHLIPDRIIFIGYLCASFLCFYFYKKKSSFSKLSLLICTFCLLQTINYGVLIYMPSLFFSSFAGVIKLLSAGLILLSFILLTKRISSLFKDNLNKDSLDMAKAQSSNFLKESKQKEHIKEQIEIQNQIIKTATSSLPSLLSYIDHRGFYQYVNQAYQTYWGIETEEIIGKHFSELIPSESLEGIKQHVANALSGHEVHFQIDINFPLKGHKKLDVNYTQHYDKNDPQHILGIIVAAHDITDFAKTQQQLILTNQQLEEYVFLVSHDLRAPIRHITNFIELLKAELTQNKLNEKEEKYMQIISDNTNKIQHMISGMLKIASVSQMKLNLENINLHQYFEDLLSKDIVNNDFQYSLEMQEDLYLYTDKDLLDLIFQNLLENSLKFKGQEKLTILIEAISNGENLVINFCDNGRGVSKSIEKKIFNAFIKSENSSGLGLGLNIVKKSLQKLEANILLQQNKNQKGTCFQIEFKRQKTK